MKPAQILVVMAIVVTTASEPMKSLAWVEKAEARMRTVHPLQSLN
jgi:hypothetical protein